MVSYLWGKAACGVATTQAVGSWMRRRKRTPEKLKNSKKHAGSMKSGKTLRLFEARLGTFSGLVDQGLVARCFRVLHRGSVPALKAALKQLSAILCCQMLQGASVPAICWKEKERQSQNLGESVTFCHATANASCHAQLGGCTRGVRGAIFVLRLPVILAWCRFHSTT